MRTCSVIPVYQRPLPWSEREVEVRPWRCSGQRFWRSKGETKCDGYRLVPNILLDDRRVEKSKNFVSWI